MLPFVYLDTETTGIDPRLNAIVEIALVDDEGRALLDTLVNPGRPIPADSTRIHGIDDAMVRDAPALADLMPTVRELVAGTHLVIYNADFDTKFFPGRLRDAGEVSCAMLAFAQAYGERDPRRGSYRWKPLDFAARHVHHAWSGKAHRALADALACRSVWRWLQAREGG